MQLKDKILSHFLLAIYLLVGLHQCVSHAHASEFTGVVESQSSHQHAYNEDFHHEHHFHIGIFHFLGHLIESINHADDLSDEHFSVAQKTTNKKIFNYISSVNTLIYENPLTILDVDAESLPDPPYHLSVLQKLKSPNTPLRAPPTLA